MKHYWSRNGRLYTLFIVILGLAILPSLSVTPPSISLVLAAPCPGSGTDITGTVFRDYNADGTDAGATEPGIAGITVTAYDTGNSPISSCETDANGAYDLTIGGSFPVRLELSNIPDYLQPGPAGPDSATTVTFVSGITSGVDFGLANPAQYCDPATDELATTCFVNGSAVNSAGGPNDTLVRWLYSLRGDGTMPTHISERDNIGSAWGLAYDPLNQDLYTAAFLKRHVGLRSGLGAIFLTDPVGAAPNGSLFVDVTSLGLDVGVIGDDTARGLVPDPSALNNDPTAFYTVGKVGLGDLTVSEDNQSLWFINLFNQTLYSLAIDSDSNPVTPPTAADLQAFPIPTGQCSSYSTLYLNAGGPNFASLAGPAWNGDGYYVGGTAGTTTGSSGAPYTTNRTGAAFDYMVPLPDGSYDVTLHVYSNSAATFAATIEGTSQAIAVAANSEHSELRSVTVTDGTMNLTFDNATVGTPTINGIQITATGGQQFNETAAFALKAHDGAMYVGLVCTAEYSQDSADLEAYVYRLANNTLPFSQVASFSLDYTKGFATTTNTCDQFGNSDWHPWASSFPSNCGNAPALRTVWPQPILSGIEFDIDDSLILTFMDRLGHQMGNNNYVLAGTEQRETVIGGDILRVHNNNGTYVLENNGTAGPLTADWLTPSEGVGNNQGPGGGEFYQDDVAPLRTHSEISVGGVAHLYGTGEAVGTVMDPIGDADSGGVMFFNNEFGSSTTTAAEDSFDGYEVYQSSGVDTFGKANGIGDLVLLCTAAPIALGNRIWLDTDADGVQDADEVGQNNVTVGLYDAAGTLLASMVTITDPQGNPGFYQFIGDGLDGATWVTADNAVQPNTTYTIAIFDTEFSGGGDLVGRLMTANDQNPDSLPTPDIRDSDGVGVSVGTGANAAVRGITLTTGMPGANDHTFDFGFVLLEADWGDAPDGIFGTYPTLLGAGSNAYHLLIAGGPYLGDCVDSETDGQPDATATGDDLAVGATTVGICTGNDDEDGITGAFLSTPLVPGDPLSPITIEIAPPAACFLNAWVDFDGDGGWDEPNDQIFTDLSLAAGTHNLTFDVPGSTMGNVTDTSARFRCSTSPGLTSTGTAADGEVEDYQVDIAGAMDLGDLPDSYGTFVTSNGGRHALGTIWLGSIVDAEPDGSPTGLANGDDIAFSDDEDGIVFIPGTWGDGTGEIDVTVSGGNGCLIGWVDFSNDGNFNDDVPDGLGTVSEHVFTEFLGLGTASLSFPAPASVTGGGTFVYPPTLNMRFRFFPPGDGLFTGLSLDGNGCPDATNSTAAMELISRGLASNGEIEDYIQGFGPTAVALQSAIITSEIKNWLCILVIFMALSLITFILFPYRRRFALR